MIVSEELTITRNGKIYKHSVSEGDYRDYFSVLLKKLPPTGIAKNVSYTDYEVHDYAGRQCTYLFLKGTDWSGNFIFVDDYRPVAEKCDTAYKRYLHICDVLWPKATLTSFRKNSCVCFKWS